MGSGSGFGGRRAKKDPKKRARKKAFEKPEPYYKGSGLFEFPPVSRNMYKFLSNIYGVPANEMTPKAGFGGGVISKGFYSPMEHTLGRSDYANFEHEAIHSLQELLGPETSGGVARESRYRKFFKKSKSNLKKLKIALKLLRDADRFKRKQGSFREASARLKAGLGAKLRSPFFSHSPSGMFMDLVFYALLFVPGAQVAGLGLGARILFRSPEIARIHLVQSYYKKYGAEGLALLFAHPPPRYELLKLKGHERYFIKRGYLDPKKGITKKGIAHIRHRVPRTELVRRLTVRRDFVTAGAKKKWEKKMP